MQVLIDSAAGACTSVRHVSDAYVSCDLGPSLNLTQTVQVVSRDETSPPVSVSRSQASLASVDPPVVYKTPAGASRQLQPLIVHGANLGLAAGDISITVAGIPCGGVEWHSPENVSCTELDTALLSAAGGQAEVSVSVRGSHGNVATLGGAVRVFGTPLLFAAQPMPVSMDGGLVTLEGVQLGLAGGQGGRGQAGDIVNVTVGSPPRLCLNVSASESSLTCTVPPGEWPLSPIVIHRHLGLTASMSSSILRRRAADVSAAHPPYVLFPPTPSASSAVVNVTLRGSGFAPASGVQSAASLQATVGNAACASVVAVSPVELLCTGLNVSTLPVDSSAAVSVTIAGQAATSNASVRVFGAPSVESILPSAVPGAGSVAIEIVGSNFGQVDGDVLGVDVGGAACTAPVVLSEARLACTVPSFKASGEVLSPAVSVRFASGAVAHAAPQSLLYSLPELYVVTPAVTLRSPPGSPRRYNVTVTGAALFNPNLPLGNASMWLAGSGCQEGGGALHFALDGRSATCVGLLASKLPQSTDGGNGAFVRVRTNEDLEASSQLGTFRVMAQPAITGLQPSVARAGAAVAVVGQNFGWVQQDIAAVRVGSVPVSSFTRTGPGGISFILPPPRSPSNEDTTNLQVVVDMVSGWSAGGGGGAASTFRYERDPLPPLTPVRDVCAYRDPADGGVTRVEFSWQDDSITQVFPVAQWLVRFSTQPWQFGGDAQVRATVNVASEDLQLVSVRHPLCNLPPAPAPRRAQGTGPSAAQRISIRVLNVPEQPVWLQVIPVTDRQRVQASSGPASQTVGPVFSSCRDDEFLATQHAAAGAWERAVCEPCPDGGVCDGHPWEALTNRAGFFRLPWSEHGLEFKQCLLPSACKSLGVSVDVSDLDYVWGPNHSTWTQHPVLMNFTVEQGPHGAFGLPAAFASVTARAGDTTVVPRTASSPALVLSTAEAALRASPQCRAGHTGVLCGKCIIGYSRTASGECATCGSQAQALSLMSIALLASFAVVAWLVRGQVISTNRLKKPHSILKKILVNHLQQTALMLNFDLSWPDPLKGSLATADTASSAGQELASPDCFRAHEIPNAPGSAFRITLLLTFVVPLAFIAVFFAVFLVMHARCGVSRRETTRRMVICLLVVTFLFYTPITRSVMQAFSCVNVGGQLRLQNDLDVVCDGSGNLAWTLGYGLPLLLLFVLGVPVLVAAVLVRFRDRLWSDEYVKSMFALLFLGYKPAFYWYEVVIMARKALFATALVFLGPQGLLYQVSVAVLVLLAALVVGMHTAPFQVHIYNTLDEASIVLSVFTLAGGIALIRSAGVGEPTEVPEGSVFQVLVTLTLTIVNIAFVMFLFGWAMLSWYQAEVAPRLPKRPSILPRRLSKLAGTPPKPSVADQGDAGPMHSNPLHAVRVARRVKVVEGEPAPWKAARRRASVSWEARPAGRNGGGSSATPGSVSTVENPMLRRSPRTKQAVSTDTE